MCKYWDVVVIPFVSEKKICKYSFYKDFCLMHIKSLAFCKASHRNAVTCFSIIMVVSHVTLPEFIIFYHSLLSHYDVKICSQVYEMGSGQEQGRINTVMLTPWHFLVRQWYTFHWPRNTEVPNRNSLFLFTFNNICDSLQSKAMSLTPFSTYQELEFDIFPT